MVTGDPRMGEVQACSYALAVVFHLASRCFACLPEAVNRYWLVRPLCPYQARDEQSEQMQGRMHSFPLAKGSTNLNT